MIQKDEDILNLKRNELKRGKRPDGSIIGTYRSSSYSKMKQGRNPLARGFVDLMDKGNFSRGLFIQKLSSRRYNFFSTDNKAPELFSKHKGKGGLQSLNQDSFIKQQVRYMPTLNRILRQRAGL